MSKEKGVLALCLVLVLLLVAVPGVAAAPPSAGAYDTDGRGGEITMRVSPGLGGLYKKHLPVELTVFVDNEGPAGRGVVTVLVDPEQPWEGMRHRQELRHTYRTELEIPAGGSARVSLVVPGSFAAAAPVVVLTVDEQELFRATVQGTLVPADGLVAVGLGEESIMGPMLHWLNEYLGPVAVKNLSPEELPASALMLRLADMVVLQPDAIGRLSSEQLRGLREWTALGGTLVLSAGAGTGPDGLPADLVPFTGAESQLVLTHSLGRGNVILSALPVQQLDLDDDYQWKELLFGAIAGNGEGTRGFPWLDLVQAGTYLPQLQLPSAAALAAFLGVYALLVGPGMYLVLRCLGRRELAWVLIPVTAVVAAAGLYLTGPLQRLPGPLIQTVAVVDIFDKRLAEVRAGAVVVLPRGGDLRLSGPETGVLFPAAGFGGRPEAVGAVVEVSDRGGDVHFFRGEISVFAPGGGGNPPARPFRSGGRPEDKGGGWRTSNRRAGA